MRRREAEQVRRECDNGGRAEEARQRDEPDDRRQRVGQVPEHGGVPADDERREGRRGEGRELGVELEAGRPVVKPHEQTERAVDRERLRGTKLKRSARRFDA